MLLRTPRFGALRIDADDVVSIPAGLPGLEDCKQWVLLTDAVNDALGWLQCTTRPDAALAVVSPRRFVPGYRFHAYRRELEPLELQDLHEAHVLAIVAQNEGRLTLNLKAPIVVNVRTRIARQVVANDDHPLQYVLPLTSSRLKKSA